DADGNAQPAGSNVFTWGPVLGPQFDCNPTQQPAVGATVSYACTDNDQATECADTGPQAAPIVVTIVGTGNATVTVTNSYADPTPEPPEPTTGTTGERTPVPTVNVSPTFTG